MLKQKLIGLVLIVVGALPFLLKVPIVGDFFNSYEFLSFIMPGEIGYQVVIIALGVLLIWRVRHRVEMRR